MSPIRPCQGKHLPIAAYKDAPRHDAGHILILYRRMFDGQLRDISSGMSCSVFLKAVRLLVNCLVTVGGNQLPAHVVSPIEVCLVASLSVMPAKLADHVRFSLWSAYLLRVSQC